LQAILPLVYYRAAGFLYEFPLVNETNPALNSLGGTGKVGLSPIFKFLLRGNKYGNRNRQVV
jgi:hypothetical protein